MRRWIARLLALLVGVLLLAFGLVVYLASSLDLVALEAQLDLAARERTGHDLDIEGLDVDLLPLPALTVEGLQLGAAPGFGPVPLLRVERARARLLLLPLLRGRVELGTLGLEGLTLRLERNQDGRGSWEILVEHLRESGSGERQRAVQAPAVRRLWIVDGAGSFVDSSTGRELLVEDLELAVSPIGTSQPMTVVGRFGLQSADPVLGAQVDLSSRIRSGERVVLVESLELAVDAELGQPAINAGISLTGPVELHPDPSRIIAPELSLDVTLSGERVPGGSQLLSLQGAVEAWLDRGDLVLDGLRLDVLGATTSGRIEVAGIPDEPIVDGYLTFEDENLRAMAMQAGRPFDLADPTALTRCSVELPFTWDGRTLTLSELVLVLDDGTLRGSLAIAGLRPPVASFDLRADHLDLDRWAGKQEGEREPLDRSGDALAGAWLEGRARVDALTWSGWNFEGLDLPLTVQDGILEIRDAGVGLAGGRQRQFPTSTDI